jgi:hypothetical protein
MVLGLLLAHSPANRHLRHAFETGHRHVSLQAVPLPFALLWWSIAIYFQYKLHSASGTVTGVLCHA